MEQKYQRPRKDAGGWVGGGGGGGGETRVAWGCRYRGVVLDGGLFVTTVYRGLSYLFILLFRILSQVISFYPQRACMLESSRKSNADVPFEWTRLQRYLARTELDFAEFVMIPRCLTYRLP